MRHTTSPCHSIARQPLDASCATPCSIIAAGTGMSASRMPMRIMTPATPRMPEMKEVTRPETARIAARTAVLMAAVRLPYRAGVLVDAGEQQPEEGMRGERVGRAQLEEPGEEVREAVEIQDIERHAEGDAHERRVPAPLRGDACEGEGVEDRKREVDGDAEGREDGVEDAHLCRRRAAQRGPDQLRDLPGRFVVEP